MLFNMASEWWEVFNNVIIEIGQKPMFVGALFLFFQSKISQMLPTRSFRKSHKLYSWHIEVSGRDLAVSETDGLLVIICWLFGSVCPCFVEFSLPVLSSFPLPPLPFSFLKSLIPAFAFILNRSVSTSAVC